MLRLELPGSRPAGRAKRFMDRVKEDMKSACVGDEDAKETDRWRHWTGKWRALKGEAERTR